MMSRTEPPRVRVSLGVSWFGAGATRWPGQPHLSSRRLACYMHRPTGDVHFLFSTQFSAKNIETLSNDYRQSLWSARLCTPRPSYQRIHVWNFAIGDRRAASQHFEEKERGRNKNKK